MEGHFRRLTTPFFQMKRNISFLYGCHYYGINEIGELKKTYDRTQLIPFHWFEYIPFLADSIINI